MSLTSLSIVALAAIAFMFAGLARPAQAFVEEIETYVLDNGLEVIVIPDRRAPVVTHMIWYRVGSADEPEGYSGIAHFLEHLMFKGTEDHPDGEFSDVIISLGGRENAFTSSDYTAYFQRVAREHLGLMMQFEADRMENLVLSEEVVAPERDVVIEERKSRVDNNPSSRLGELIDAMLYVNHPYGRPVIGWMHEIEALDRDAAIDFYDRFYTPNNAILVVAGDVEPEDVLQLAEETYGQVERRAEPGDRERPRDPAPIAPREVTLTDPRVTQESLRRAYVVPSYTTDTPGEAEALDVMANILGGGSTSFLYQRLVVEERIASSAGAFYSGSALDDGRLTIFAVPAPGVDLDALEAAIDQALADFANLEITEERLARAQYSLVASAIFAQDDQSTMARVFGIARTTGQTVEDVLAWPDRIDDVEVADIEDVFDRFVTIERSVTAFLRAPEPPEAAQVEDTEGDRS